MTREACCLCGASDDTRVFLLPWSDGQWGVGPRCRDEEACRKRVIAQGEEWPLRSKANA